MDFENTFLYFFSTIPQVLSGLIALLGVFVLFKFQSIKSAIVSFGRQTLDYLDEDFILKISDDHINSMKKNLQHGIVRNDQETVASQVSGINTQLKKNVDTNSLTKHQESILWKINHNNEIQFNCLTLYNTISGRTKIILLNSGIVIILSLIFLLIVPILTSEGTCLLYPFVGAGIILIWFGYCIVETIKIIKTSINRDY
mgnify:CR=1 FL=1|tara:strand:+ start:2691 stop:3290 length:600 start_codon:yes stop_codon:yes gene_type:complete